MATNKQAFESYYQNSERADIILSLNNIDTTLSDNLELSTALGMRELAIDPNYKQGKTSQTLDKDARASLLSRANFILKKYGISTEDEEKPAISSYKW